jgi:hypothetical protein
LLLTAPAGAGKSALLIRWIAVLNQQSQWSPVFIPISIGFDTNRPDVFFGALANALSELLGKDLPIPAGDHLLFYRHTVIDLLDSWPAAAPNCIVIADGLDEAAGWQLDTSVLPPRPKPNLRIVVSAREMANTDASIWMRRVGWTLDRSDVEEMTLSALSRGDIHFLLREVSVGGTESYLIALREVLYDLTSGDPYLLQLYVTDILEAQKHGKHIEIDTLRKITPGFHAYFSRWMDQQRKLLEASKRTFNEDLTKACVAILAVSYGPLRHSELEALVPFVHVTRCIVDADTIIPIQRFLVGNGTTQGYAFAHSKFGIYVREEYLKHGPWITTAQRAYVRWGARILRRINEGSLASDAVPSYLLTYYTSHLVQTNADLDHWAALVREGWRLAHEEVDDDANGFARDVLGVLRQARHAALRQKSPTAMSLLARCALILGSIHARRTQFSALLLAAAVRTGVMKWRTAQNIASIRLDPEDRSLNFTLLAEEVTPENRERLLDLAHDAATKIDNQQLRIDVQRSLILTRERICSSGLLNFQDFGSNLEALGFHSAEALARMLPRLASDDSEKASEILYAFIKRNLQDSINYRKNSIDIQNSILTILQFVPQGWVEKIFDLMTAMKFDKFSHLLQASALIGNLPDHRIRRLAEEVLKMGSYRSHAESTLVLGELGRRSNPMEKAEILANLMRTFEAQSFASIENNQELRAASTHDDGSVQRSSVLPTSRALQSVLESRPSEARLRTLIAMLPFLVVEDARIALSEIVKKMRRSEKFFRFRELVEAIPDSLVDELIDLTCESIPEDCIAKLCLNASSDRIDRLLVTHPYWKTSFCFELREIYKRVSADMVRSEIAECEGIGDEDLLLRFEIAELRHSPVPIESRYQATLERVLQLIGSRGYLRAIEEFAPILRETDALRIIESPRIDVLSCIELLLPNFTVAGLPRVLRAIASKEDLEHLCALLLLIAKFPESGAVTANLSKAIVTVLILDRYGVRKEVLINALRRLTIPERESVGKLAEEKGVDPHIILTYLIEAEDDQTMAQRYLDRLITMMKFPNSYKVRSAEFSAAYQRNLQKGLEACLNRFSFLSGDLGKLAYTLMVFAVQIQDATVSAEYLFALIRTSKLRAIDVVGAQYHIRQALQAARPESLARLLRVGADLLAPIDRDEAFDRLFSTMDSIAPDQRLEALLALAPYNGDSRIGDWIRSTLNEIFLNAVPNIARDFKDDITELLDSYSLLIAESAAIGARSDRYFFSNVPSLKDDLRWRLTVYALVVGSFTTRPFLLERMIPALDLLKTIVSPEAIYQLVDDAREVKAWYP